LLRDLLT